MSFARMLAIVALTLTLAGITLALWRGWKGGGRVRKTILILLIILALGETLALYPIPLLPYNDVRTPDGTTSGPRPGFPAVLVVGEAMEAGDFHLADWSHAWVNTLVQEISGCSTISVASLNDDLLREIRLLVLSGGASRSLTESAVAKVGTWVEGGGSAIVEQRSNILSNLTGVRVGGTEEIWSPVRVTKVAGSPQESKDLLGIPLSTSCLRLSTRSEDTIVAMEMDDQPVVVARHLGEGAVYTFLFDVGQELTALQQGVPEKGFRVVDKRGAKGVVDATDLISDPDLLDCPIPFADVLERWILGLLETNQILPRLWYFPYTYDGAVAITHDEDWFGDASCFVSEYEQANSYSSTFFMIAGGPLTPQGLGVMGDEGADIQIHWNREMRRWLIAFRKGDGNLRKQIQVLEDKLGGQKDVSICRIERLRWGGHYTRPYRIMESEGLKLDSSLGSAGKTGRGYLFGTGMPFHPVDTNGELFSLLELPFQIQARYSGVDQSYIGDLLRNSSSCYHQIINALYHPSDLVQGSPSRPDWLVFHKLAQEENHWVFTLSDLLGWWTAREGTNISHVEWNGHSLSFDCVCGLDQMAVMIPLSHNGLGMSSIVVDSGDPKATRTVSLQGRDYLLARVDRGAHSISIAYR